MCQSLRARAVLVDKTSQKNYSSLRKGNFAVAYFVALEREVIRFFREYERRSLLIAFSGGADSMALLLLLSRIRKACKLHLSVAHVHHGGGAKLYRDRAWRFAKSKAEELELPFFSNCSRLPCPIVSKSEAEEDLRNLRYNFLQQTARAEACDFIVLGHHEEDLFETRLIRLIRGTGPEGIVAMKEKEGNLLRPFLRISKKRLVEYLAQKKERWLDDPSNQEHDFLRNWVRGKWLPELERERPGAQRAVARSLQLLADYVEAQSNWADELLAVDGSLLRPAMLALSTKQKKQLIASYLKNLGCRAYRSAQVDEIVKRLDSSRKTFTFVLAGHRWQIDAQHIKAVPLKEREHS